MSESTLRRHLAALTHAGLVQRHDSPNGKRYATRSVSGKISRAFGFDLRPLLTRSQEIAAAAETTRQQSERYRHLREHVSLRLRDAEKFMRLATETCPTTDSDAIARRLTNARKALRRKLSFAELQDLDDALKAILRDARNRLESLTPTTEMVAVASHNDRHYQNSEPDEYESELCAENVGSGAQGPDLATGGQHASPIRIPLALIMKACPTAALYASDPILTWGQAVALAAYLHGMMGISPDCWRHAFRVMGPEIAALAVFYILEQMPRVNSPGAYLRTLTIEAERGTFRPQALVMALLSRSATKAPRC